MNIQKNERGFDYANFKDFFGNDCSIMKSSLAEHDCIWLGVDEHRMHLSQTHVEELLPMLQRFVKTGDIAESIYIPKDDEAKMQLALALRATMYKHQVFPSRYELLFSNIFKQFLPQNPYTGHTAQEIKEFVDINDSYWKIVADFIANPNDPRFANEE